MTVLGKKYDYIELVKFPSIPCLFFLNCGRTMVFCQRLKDRVELVNFYCI